MYYKYIYYSNIVNVFVNDPVACLYPNPSVYRLSTNSVDHPYLHSPELSLIRSGIRELYETRSQSSKMTPLPLGMYCSTTSVPSNTLEDIFCIFTV